MDLPQKLAIKAQNELNEVENVRTKCLADFKLWLARHDYFVDCRKGSNENLMIQANILFILAI
jgi:hypothetical protein